MQGPLVVLTGASGSGKTSIAEKIAQEHPEITVFRFDTIGVPSPEVMATYGAGHQPGGAWLRAMTLQWFKRISEVLAQGQAVLFEGQMRIAFVLEALAENRIAGTRLICVECDDATRRNRLTHFRCQPELANESMAGWSRYLRQEAVESGFDVLDTTDLSLAQSTAQVLAAFPAGTVL